jgi:ABC-2 type transport system ATP-binding protein
VIEVENLSVRFPDYRGHRWILSGKREESRQNSVLERINMQIRRNELVVFMGHNGAGKTTLLKTIGGLFHPCEGRVLVNGINTTRKNIRSAARLGYAFADERSFYWRLSARENLEFFGALDEIPGKELKRRISGILEDVGLGRYTDRLVSRYSTGMRQRLSLARALLSRPEVLILDEPTKALDPIAASEMRMLIKHVHGRIGGMTLLMASHDFEEAGILGGRVIFLGGGKVLGYYEKDESKNSGMDLEQSYQSYFDGRKVIPR